MYGLNWFIKSVPGHKAFTSSPSVDLKTQSSTDTTLAKQQAKGTILACSLLPQKVGFEFYLCK
jgi:hypothetical protein